MVPWGSTGRGPELPADERRPVAGPRDFIPRHGRCHGCGKRQQCERTQRDGEPAAGQGRGRRRQL